MIVRAVATEEVIAASTALQALSLLCVDIALVRETLDNDSFEVEGERIASLRETLSAHLARYARPSPLI